MYPCTSADSKWLSYSGLMWHGKRIGPGVLRPDMSDHREKSSWGQLWWEATQNHKAAQKLAVEMSTKLPWMFHCLPFSAQGVPWGACFLSSFPFCTEIEHLWTDACAVLLAWWSTRRTLLWDAPLVGYAWCLPHHGVPACGSRSVIRTETFRIQFLSPWA